jgi:uncharacterized membrane protein YfcA
MSALSYSVVIPCLVIGIFAGIASGLFGVGGGIIIIPALMFWFSYSQQAANGTSLVALLLPVGSFAVWNYWRAGKIHMTEIHSGLFIGLGIAFGALLGSQIAVSISEDTLRRAFSIFLALIALKLWFTN